MGLCLFVKPFRSLKGKLQTKGDLKRHSFASLVRSSFISGASIDRRSLYFLGNESSPRFTTTSSHHQNDDGVMTHRTNDNGPRDAGLPDVRNHESIESEEEKELETLSQKAVDDALSTVTEEYLEDFADRFVATIFKNIQSAHKSNDAILERYEQRSTFKEPHKVEPKTNGQVQQDTVPIQDNNGQDNNDTLFSPVDYTSLCVPKDYCIYGNHGNRLDKMAKEDREAVLSKRGVWPSDEAIEYQFTFVETMKGIEAENEREVDGNLASLSKLRDYDGGYGDESHDESSDEDDNESLTITFEVGPSKINRYPDRPSHYISNDIVDSLTDCMQEGEDKHATSPLSSPSHSDQCNTDAPLLHSPPVMVSPPHRRRGLPPPPPPPPRPPYHIIYQNGHTEALPPIMDAPRDVHQFNHQMMVMMGAVNGAREHKGVQEYWSRLGYSHQWQDRRHYQSPAPSQNRAPPYPVRSNYRSGQRFGGGYDRRNNHHQNRDQFTTPNQQMPPPTERYQHQHQSRPRPTPVPYNPSRQSASYDRAPPQPCRQGDRWDTSTRQSYPFRQEWGGPTHQFGSSYHHNHQQHHHYVDRNNNNRRQR